MEVYPGIIATDPTVDQRAIITAAQGILLQSALTFQLFDFSQGAMVTRSIADMANNVPRSGVPFLTANLFGPLGALAAVFNTLNPDGTVNIGEPVYLVFDRSVLATRTTEAIASIMAHESWHVNQIYNGIMNDFVNYPRVVDIEYEAFVVGTVVWNDIKGPQTERSLDAGAGCVAAGEARCKEILVTDFGYPTGPRNG